jgi:Cu/Ag efflux pump CusA
MWVILVLIVHDSFHFSFDRERLSDLWLTPSDVQSEIYSAINGVKAGTMMVDTKERDIVLKTEYLCTDDVSPEMLYNLVIDDESMTESVWVM